MTAALVGILLACLYRWGVHISTWRMMFLIGVVPALLTVVIMRRLKEPEALAEDGVGKDTERTARLLRRADL